MTETSRRKIRLSGPTEVIAAVPYLLGFTPGESLAIVALNGRQVVVTARMDLADLAGDEGRPHLAAIALAMVRSDAESVVIVYFSESDLPASLTRTVDELVTAALKVDDALVVRGGRWRSLLCQNEACCPPEGRPLPNTPPAGVLEMIEQTGTAPLPSRDALFGLVEALPPEHEAYVDGDAVTSADLGDVTALRQELFRLAQDNSAVFLPVEQAARLACVLGLHAIRDEMWLAMDREEFEGRKLDGREFLRTLARQVDSPARAAPLFLFGFAAWRRGDGALAGVAAEAALQADPGYTAAEILQRALVQGVNPFTFPPMKKG